MNTCDGKHHVFPSTVIGSRCECGDYVVNDSPRGMRRRHKPISELLAEAEAMIRRRNAN